MELQLLSWSHRVLSSGDTQKRRRGRGWCCNLHPGQEALEREVGNASRSHLFPRPIGLWLLTGQPAGGDSRFQLLLGGGACPQGPLRPSPHPPYLSIHPSKQVQLRKNAWVRSCVRCLGPSTLGLPTVSLSLLTYFPQGFKEGTNSTNTGILDFGPPEPSDNFLIKPPTV